MRSLARRRRQYGNAELVTGVLLLGILGGTGWVVVKKLHTPRGGDEDAEITPEQLHALQAQAEADAREQEAHAPVPEVTLPAGTKVGEGAGVGVGVWMGL